MIETLLTNGKLASKFGPSLYSSTMTKIDKLSNVLTNAHTKVSIHTQTGGQQGSRYTLLGLY